MCNECYGRASRGRFPSGPVQLPCRRRRQYSRPRALETDERSPGGRWQLPRPHTHICSERHGPEPLESPPRTHSPPGQSGPSSCIRTQSIPAPHQRLTPTPTTRSAEQDLCQAVPHIHTSPDCPHATHVLVCRAQLASSAECGIVVRGSVENADDDRTLRGHHGTSVRHSTDSC